MTANCGVAALLRPGGPVRVPLRECCVAALVGADGAVMRCAAAPCASSELGVSPGHALAPGPATAAAQTVVSAPGSRPEPAPREPIEVPR